MTHPLLSRSTHASTQPRFPVIEFEPLLDSVEAAALLRIHPKTLQKKARHGVIPGRQIGKCWRFRVSDLNEWLWHQEHAVLGPEPGATRLQAHSVAQSA